VVHDGDVRVVAFTEEEAELSATWLSVGTINGTLVQSLRCVDVDNEHDEIDVPIELAPANRTSEEDPSDGPAEAGSEGTPVWVLAVPLLLLVALVTAFVARSKPEQLDETSDAGMSEEAQEALWGEASDASAPALQRPEGWSVEQYAAWLDGPQPEGWTEEAWSSFVEEQSALNQ